MNQLNKHRLIGGSVLLFAALLFAPAILSPHPNSFANPRLSVRIDSENEAKPSQVAVLDRPHETPAVSPSVDLESVGTDGSSASQSLSGSTGTPSAIKPATPAVAGTPTRPLPPIPRPQSERPKPARPQTATAKPPKPAAKPTPAPRPKQGIVLESTAPKESWLRVGSFSKLKNANNLIRRLQRNDYPVKVEVSTVDGKTYHRVLVGPYNDEKTLQKAKVSLTRSGHKPSVQR